MKCIENQSQSWNIVQSESEWDARNGTYNEPRGRNSLGARAGAGAGRGAGTGAGAVVGAAGRGILKNSNSCSIALRLSSLEGS